MRVGDRVKVEFRMFTTTIHKAGTVRASFRYETGVVLDGSAMMTWYEPWRVSPLDEPPAGFLGLAKVISGRTITHIEIAMALEGNQAPAANADEWETEMLYLLAEYDRLNKARQGVR